MRNKFTAGWRGFAAAALFLVVLLAACQSMRKDLFVSSPKDKLELNLAELEQMIVALDKPAADITRRAGMTDARKKLERLRQEADADADYAGKLAAWSGRLAILEGKYSDARRLYRDSQGLSSGNVPSIILGIRLEGDPAKRLEMTDSELSLAGSVQSGAFSSGAGELQIERARALLELHRFAEAAGAFDTAFASGLDMVYAETYRDSRDRAWELRNASAASGSLEILQQGGLTWKDCITLAKKETQLLRFISAGRDLNETELFSRLLDRSFIPYSQDVALDNWPQAKPKAEDQVFRSGAAYLLWHLYAEARGDRGLLTKYSARYAPGSNPRSPIADVPPLSPFLDSILGSIETELLSLPDGRNFRPAEPVRGTEFLSALQKAGN